MRATILLALLLLAGCCLSDRGCRVDPPCSTGVCHSAP